MKQLLFLCTKNSCRSQMAEGWARHLLSDRFEAASAGSAPATVDPRAIAVMAEAGIDITSHHSKSLEDFKDSAIDHVFTLCGDARDRCPVWPGDATLQHHGFDDPPRLGSPDDSPEQTLVHYRRVRDEIAAWIRALPEELGADD